MTEPELHDALDRATDGIVSPGLAGAALGVARRRRARRRGAAVGVLSSVAVAAVVVGVVVGGGPSTVSPTPPGPSTPTPTGTPSIRPTTETVIWPRWDPRDVDDLPRADDAVAPAIPATIEPPTEAPDVASHPMGSAVLAVLDDGIVKLLGTDGGWRQLAVAGSAPRVALSPSGRRLVMWRHADYDQAEVYDLRRGSFRSLGYPPSYQPYDLVRWIWADDDTLVLASGSAWVVDAADASATGPRPLPSAGYGATVDPDGNLLDSSDPAAPATVTDWASGEGVEHDSSGLGHLASLGADAATVVGTSYDAGDPGGFGDYGLVLADRATLDPLVRLPLGDHEGNYSNGGLGVLALADDGTVLLQVAAYDGGPDGFRVVAFDPGTGELSLVSRAPLPVESSVVFAAGALRGTG